VHIATLALALYPMSLRLLVIHRTSPVFHQDARTLVLFPFGTEAVRQMQVGQW